MATRVLLTKVRFRALFCVSLGLGLAALALPAAAEPAIEKEAKANASPAGDDAIAELLASPEYIAQREAQGLGEVVSDTAYSLDPSAGSGYASRTVGPNSLVLYWKGDVPGPILELISKSSVRVEVRQASYSREEILAKLDELTLDKPSAIEDAGFVQAGASTDWNALEVVTIDPIPETRMSGLSSFRGVPLRLRSGGKRGVLLAGRQGDSAPFYGGAHVYRANGEDATKSCTSGFPIRVTATGVQGILGARHCGTAKWYAKGTNAYIGQRDPNKIWDARDAMINVGGLSYGNKVYTGAWNTDVAKFVSGHGNVGRGDLVVINGAISGGFAHRVVDIDKKFDSGDPFTPGSLEVGPGFFSQDIGNRLTVGQGDSGAPVVNPHGQTSTTHVVARGQLSAAVDPTPLPRFDCAGMPNVLRYCDYRAFSINSVAILNSLGLSLITNTP